MQYIAYLVFALVSNAVFGQYTLDRQILNHAFFKTVEADPEERFTLRSYYEPGGDKLQEQLKNTLRASFSDEELFEIAQYSKMPFCRLAAFELYAQTDYSEDAVIQFLKRGKIPSSWDTPKDSVPEVYTPLPSFTLAMPAPIRIKMLEMINPGALKRIQKNSGDSVLYEPAYPESRPLDLERFVALQTYVRYYVEDRTSGAWNFFKPGEKKPVLPTFDIVYPEMDFGTIDLAYLDSTKTDFMLSGAMKVINNTSKSITLMGQASGHTMCLNGRYVIPPHKDMMVEFKSLVRCNLPQISRSITLTNLNTGDAQIFKFKAKFIHTRS